MTRLTRHIAQIVLAAGICLATAAPSYAQSHEEALIMQLKVQGYTRIERSRTFLGRVRLEAEGNGTEREIIFNPRTGEILRDYWEYEDDDDKSSLLNPADDDDSSSGGGSGGSGDDDLDDDGGDDDGSDAGEDDDDDRDDDDDDDHDDDDEKDEEDEEDEKDERDDRDRGDRRDTVEDRFDR